MSDFCVKWAGFFNKAVTQFSGRNKVAVRELKDVVEGTSDLVGSLQRIDTLDPDKLDKVRQAKERAKAVDALGKEIKGPFTKAVAGYRKVLETVLPKVDKVIWPEANKALKALLANLNWVEAAVTSHHVLCGKSIDEKTKEIRKEIEKKEKEMRKEGATDTEVNAATNFLKQMKQLVTFPAVSKTVLAKAVAAVKLIKAEPTRQAYHDHMDKGGRNYTQQVINLVKLADEPSCPDDLRQIIAPLRPHRAHLAEFGGEAKRDAPEGATRQDILDLASEYSQLVKETWPVCEQVAKWIIKRKKGK